MSGALYHEFPTLDAGHLSSSYSIVFAYLASPIYPVPYFEFNAAYKAIKLYTCPEMI